MTGMQLREPLWLLLALLPVILWLCAYLIKRWRFTPYADAHLLDWVIARQQSQRRTRIRQGIFIQLAWACFAIAMAGPRTPVTIQDSNENFETQVYAVVDVSLSMSARDVRPSRIERVKLELLDLIERMQRTRLGIIVYAAQAHVLCPPTTDKSVLRHYIQTLRTELLPTAGSRIDHALLFSAKQLAHDTQSSKAVLLITDGEQDADASSLAENNKLLSQIFKQQQISLFVLGVGSDRGAALLTRQQGWLQHDNQAVISKLDSTYLTQLAALGNGEFQQITDDDSDWAALYDRGIAQLPFSHSSEDITQHIQWQESFSGFLLAGLVCLLIAIWQSKHTEQAQLLIMPLAFVLLLSISPESSASDNYTQAFKLYQQGELQSAREIFATIPGYQGRFAEGSVAYQQGEYEQAIPSFVQAILDAGTQQQRIDAIFNLANSYFKLDNYLQAAALYQDVLRYQPNHRAAQINLEYASALIEENKQSPQAKAQRPGTGPRTADAPIGMDVGRSSLALGESASQSENSPKTPTETSPQQQAEHILQQSRPASERIEYDKDLSWTYDITSLSVLKQNPKRIDTNEAILWQRLFEVEENFEAAQDAPNLVPGVKPW